MPTAFLQASVIDQYLLTELEKGFVAGPFSISPLTNLNISHFGIIAKKYQSGKWQLILYLSSSQGHSVNEGIPKDPFLVQYMKVDNIIESIMTHGRETCLAKFAVESAYHIIPVHSHHRYLLGMKWRGEYFIDWPYPSVYVLLLSYSLPLLTCLSGFQNTIMKYNFYFITWMTSIPWALLTLLSANKTWISVFVCFQSGVFPSTLVSLRALLRA